MSKYLISLVIYLISPVFAGTIHAQTTKTEIKVGAENVGQYLPLLGNKNVALLINHTSVIGKTHLLDTLLRRDIKVVKIFAPEHGFRGNKDNGGKVDNEIDEKTGLPIISLYGKSKKPSAEDLSSIDVVVYDIQDVGARFYTYISAMHYMMEACAENGIEMIVLDRPNPNGHYVDGPVLEMAHQSYVGMHPIPIVYGMTSGEVALMIKGENWLKTDADLKLTVIKNQGYTHQSKYILPIPPSPNLPNAQSILLYPSLCLFEGTNVSMGRGTEFPFQVLGTPDSLQGRFAFKPISILGVSDHPKFENEICYGVDLRNAESSTSLDLSYLIQFYNQAKDKSTFFISFFTKLAGTETLQRHIMEGKTEAEIKSSWQPELEKFKTMRKKYLLYD